MRADLAKDPRFQAARRAGGYRPVLSHGIGAESQAPVAAAILAAIEAGDEAACGRLPEVAVENVWHGDYSTGKRGGLSATTRQRGGAGKDYC
jgi:hypothetical protein